MQATITAKGALLAVAVGSLGVAGYLAATVHVGELRPAPESFVRSAPKNLVVHYSGRVSGARMWLDGQLLPTSLEAVNHKVVARGSHLADGEHEVALELKPSLGWRAFQTIYHFTLDSKPPQLRWTSPKEQAFVTVSPCEVSGYTETGTRLFLGSERVSPPGERRNSAPSQAMTAAPTVVPSSPLPSTLASSTPLPTSTSMQSGLGVGGDSPRHSAPSLPGSPQATPSATPREIVLTPDARGQFQTRLPLEEGSYRLTLRAVDRAGNQTVVHRQVMLDKTPPQVLLAYPAPDAVIKLDPTVTFRAQLKDEGSGLGAVRFALDEFAPQTVKPDPGGRIAVPIRDMVQGRHRVTLTVTDRAGLTTEHVWNLLVNTSERFGEAVLGPGALGADVKTLQQRLQQEGELPKGSPSGVYDETTAMAVRTFQSKHHINVDGLAGFATLAALSPSIRINLTRFTLELRQGDRVLKVYNVAHGMPAYPTPIGNFRVTFLQKDPTWLPPKGSLWAKEAKATPPGPGNPLGTRWIGLNSSCVGIHGTNAEWTVGSRASHGCVRMKIKDVEDLFARINLSTPVAIFWEKKPAHAKAPKVGARRTAPQ